MRVMLAAILAVAAFLWNAGSGHGAPNLTAQMTVRLTVYLPTGHVMHSGYYPFWGAAACSWNFPEGTVLELPDGHRVTCLDRGLLGASGWVDIYTPDWATARWVQAYYGPWTTVAIVRWGWS